MSTPVKELRPTRPFEFQVSSTSKFLLSREKQNLFDDENPSDSCRFVVTLVYPHTCFNSTVQLTAKNPQNSILVARFEEPYDGQTTNPIQAICVDFYKAHEYPASSSLLVLMSEGNVLETSLVNPNLIPRLSFTDNCLTISVSDEGKYRALSTHNIIELGDAPDECLNYALKIITRSNISKGLPSRPNKLAILPKT